MKPTSIDHIAIYVNDLQKSKDFFENVLMLPIDGVHGDEVFFRVGKQKLAIFQGNTKAQSINHLAIGVVDFDKAIKHIVRSGYKVYESNMVDGPEGLSIQIVRSSEESN